MERAWDRAVGLRYSNKYNNNKNKLGQIVANVKLRPYFGVILVWFQQNYHMFNLFQN